MITGTPTRLQRDVARIIGTVAPTVQARPALVVLAGLPGTGKTHLARELSARTAAVLLESDAIRRLLCPDRRYTRAESRRLFTALHGATEALLARSTAVIVDATNLAEREREPLYDIAARRNAKLILVHVMAPEELARERLSKRRAGGPSNSEADGRVYDRMRYRVEEIRRPHHVIDTSRDIEPALATLMKEMMTP
jgi:predicted kinase